MNERQVALERIDKKLSQSPVDTDLRDYERARDVYVAGERLPFALLQHLVIHGGTVTDVEAAESAIEKSEDYTSPSGRIWKSNELAGLLSNS